MVKRVFHLASGIGSGQVVNTRFDTCTTALHQGFCWEGFLILNVDVLDVVSFPHVPVTPDLGLHHN